MVASIYHHALALLALRYRDEIRRPLWSLYAEAFTDEFILMDDSAKPHCAYLVDSVLLVTANIRMYYPVRSPDMNLIRHVCDM